MNSALLVVEKNGAQHRQWRFLGWGYALAIIVLVPLVLQPFELGKMNRALVISVAILAVNLVVGYGGMLALGHSAFMGIGAFVTASMIQDENWDYWMVIPVVLLVGFVVGIIVGLPALRVKGLYLALVTIAQAAVFPTLVNIDELGIAERTGGPNGRDVSEVVDRPSFLEWLPGVDGARGDSAYRYWILVVILGIVFLLVRNILHSRAGRSIIATRDNQAGAAVYGINLPIYRTANFALSSALGSLAGLMWCLDKGFVAGQDFTFLLAIDLIIGLVIGGVATLQGSLLGGLFVVWVRDLTKRIAIPLGFYTLDGGGPLSNAIFGLVLILFTFFAPGGIASLIQGVQNKIIRVVPLTPDGAPISDMDSLDPGPDTRRSDWALRLAVIGPVALVIGWLATNVNNLIVGVFAFGFRLSIVVLAPIAIFVGSNEWRAARAGKRGDRNNLVASRGRNAAILGILGFAYFKAYALNLALMAHHAGHLKREYKEATELGANVTKPEPINVGFWLFGYDGQTTLAIVLSVLAIAATLFVGHRLFLTDESKPTMAQAEDHPMEALPADHSGTIAIDSTSSAEDHTTEALPADADN